MEIYIGEKYKLTSDTNNVIINERYQKKTKEGEEPKFDYKEVGYYPTLDKACVALLGKQLRDSEATTVKELLAEIKLAKEEIIKGVNK